MVRGGAEPQPRPAVPADQQGRQRRHGRGARHHAHRHGAALEGGAAADRRDRDPRPTTTSPTSGSRPPPSPRASTPACSDNRLAAVARRPAGSVDVSRRARRHRPRRHLLVPRPPGRAVGAGGGAPSSSAVASRCSSPPAVASPRPASPSPRSAWRRRPSCSTVPSASTSARSSGSTWRRSRSTRRSAAYDAFVSVGLSPVVYVDDPRYDVFISDAPSTNPAHVQALGDTAGVRWGPDEPVDRRRPPRRGGGVTRCSASA